MIRVSHRMFALVALSIGAAGACTTLGPRSPGTAGERDGGASAAVEPPCPDGSLKIHGATFQLYGEDTTVRTFCMDRLEVTCGAYAECIRGGICRPIPPMLRIEADASASEYELARQDIMLRKRYLPRDAVEPDPNTPSWTCDPVDLGLARAAHPMVCTTIDDARAFCRARGGRLPLPDEWQLAARGPKRTLFPWGTALPATKSIAPSTPDSTPVGTHPDDISSDGIMDMYGSVFELHEIRTAGAQGWWSSQREPWSPIPTDYVRTHYVAPAVESGATPGQLDISDALYANRFDTTFDSEMYHYRGRLEGPCGLCSGRLKTGLQRSRDTGFRCVYDLNR